MLAFPHTYTVSATSHNTGSVTLGSAQLPNLETAPPPQFGGAGGAWSPETLLCASIADCFVLTFHALSRAARLQWQRLECGVEGTLERVERVSRFTRFNVTARLTLSSGDNAEKARDLLEQAERGCLVSNSLSGSRTLLAEVVVVDIAEQQATAGA